MPLNVALLRRIQEHIREEPRRFIMSAGIILSAPGTEIADTDVGDETDEDASPVVTREVPACGTVACIAGWACVLSGKKLKPRAGSRFGEVSWDDVSFGAAGLLGLRHGHGTGELFHVANWPEPFQYDYLVAETHEERAEIACARIDAFIAMHREQS